MAKLTRYQDFLDRVDELGFMALSRILPGLPSLSEETPRSIWHTGDDDTDPWHWKDRAAEEKGLAYGCILGGHKGFVSARMYPVFYAAYHPAESMPDRWTVGQVNQMTWRLWQLFEERTSLNTSSVRHLSGVTPKGGASQVDAALRELQRDYYITVAGNERKVSLDGRSYGWPAIVYCRVMGWVPPDWINGAAEWPREEAREKILDDGVAIGKHVRREGLARKLGLL
jgi:hypothetical protein